MFGIGSGELFFIMIVILMFFGSDKIPDIARTLGKGIAQLKNATNDIKNDIQQGMQNSGLDHNSLTGGIAEEITKAKEGFTKMLNESNSDVALKSELDQIRENFAKINTDANPAVREFNPSGETIQSVAKQEEVKPIAEVVEPVKETPKVDIPENHDGPIKRQG